MPVFQDLVGEKLVWVRISRAKRDCELQHGGDVLATLGWRDRKNTLARWGEQRFWFSHEGWFRQRTEIRVATDDVFRANAEPLASFLHQGNSGLLLFTDGRVFAWKKPKRWTNAHVWTTGASVLARIEPDSWRSSVKVMIEPAAAAHSETPLLVLLGQYLHTRAAEEAETAAIVASVIPAVTS